MIPVYVVKYYDNFFSSRVVYLFSTLLLVQKKKLCNNMCVETLDDGHESWSEIVDMS